MVFQDLTYDSARAIVQDGDIVFVHGNNKSLTREVVMWATSSKFTHVAIAFWATIAGEQRLMCVEAQAGTKRRIINASFYADRTITIVRAPKPWTEVVSTALERVGTEKYGWTGAIYVGLRERLARAFGWRLPTMNIPHEICSEFVANVYRIVNPCVSPQGLFEELTQIS